MEFSLSKEIKPPRDENVILEELRLLTRSPGYVHALAGIIVRDLISNIKFEKVGESRVWDRSRLNNNEICLIAAVFAAHAEHDFGEHNTAELIAQTDSLLEELHQHFEQPMKRSRDAAIKGEPSSIEFYNIAPEIIFYGAESAYAQQYRTIARDRYRNDLEWLQKNMKISIRPMMKVVDTIFGSISFSTDALLGLSKSFKPDSTFRPIDSLVVQKVALRRRLGDSFDQFIKLFSVGLGKCAPMNSALDFNEVSAKPLIDLGDYLFVVSTYKLCETIYESPFYWMQSDTAYKNTAATNRGIFVEKTISGFLGRVFGNEFVHENVKIFRSKGQIESEADTLLLYGEFALVLQAKSKRLTIKSRQGDRESLHRDFQSAVQDAYDQAVKFSKSLLAGCDLHLKDGTILNTKPLRNVFPVVVLSEHFPSLQHLAEQLLKLDSGFKPALIDIFFLDTLTTVLDDPLEILYYFQQRSILYDRIFADSEYNILGFHIRDKLYLSGEPNFVIIDAEFAKYVDQLMAERASKKGKGVARPLITRFNVQEIEELIDYLKTAGPYSAGLCLELMDLSAEALKRLVHHIKSIRKEVLEGKSFKSFSIETAHAGLTYCVSRTESEISHTAAEKLGEKHKYRAKKDRWYILLDLVQKPAMINGFLPLLYQWQKSDEIERDIEITDRSFKSSQIDIWKD